MHLLLNSVVFVVLLNLVFTLAVSNDTSALYFPADSAGSSSIYDNQVSGLVAKKTTNEYEKNVDDIIATGISKLTVTLNRLLNNQARGTNVVFSPLSISGALALILLGSNGITFKEISELMGLTTGIPDLNTKSQIVHEEFSRLINKLISTSGFNLGQNVNVALALFVQAEFPIRSLYRTTAEELYHSSIVNVDFHGNPGSAQQQVNKWVETNTNGKIKSVLNDFPSRDTKVIVASVLYFNAEWENHFFPGSTQRRPFYVNGRKSPSHHVLDMMSNGGIFPYYKDLNLGCEILGLPYKGNKSTMYVVMPFESSTKKLQEFESKLTEADLERLVSRTNITDTVILFPKMKIESTFDLKRPLEYLGLRSLFNPSQANLALLSPGEFSYRVDTSSSAVLHQSGTANEKILILSQRNHSTISTKINDQAITFDNRGQANVVPDIESRSTLSLDNIRQLLNNQSTDNHYQNPGLYADQVIHKVYIDITEKGTEAAAATSVSLSRAGGRVTFRVDVPFLFFIRHEETKTILFWGSVALPTPNY